MARRRAEQIESSSEDRCMPLGRVDQLAAEIVGAAYSHPVAAAFSAIKDAGHMDRGHPVFDYSVMLVDSIDFSLITLQQYQTGAIEEEAAVAMLQRRLAQVTDPIPEKVAKAMEGYALKPDTSEYASRAIIDVLFQRAEQIVANNTRLAEYVYVEEFDDNGVEKDSPIRDYMWDLDAQLTEAESIRGKLREGKLDEADALKQMIQVCRYVLAPTEQIKVRSTGDQSEAIFSTYNELSTIAELSGASRAVRLGHGTEDQKTVAGYLDAMVQQAGEIKESFREHMVGFDIALIVLRSMVDNARKVAPDAAAAGARLAKPYALPKIYQPEALAELARIEGPEWLKHQEEHRSEPTTFYANLTPATVIREMRQEAEARVKAARGPAAKQAATQWLETVEKLMVSSLVPGTGIIEGKINDYVVANDGKLTKRRRAW